MFLEIFIFILCLILFAAFGGKQMKITKKWKVFRISVNAVFDFMFRMKGEDRLDAFRKIHKLFPKFTHFDFLGLKVLLVYDPEVAKKVFTSTQLMQRPFRSYAPLIDKGLLFSSYNVWREPRKHLNLAFNLNVLKGFIPIFSSYSRITITEMEEHVNGDEFDVLLFMAQLTYRTVSATLLNVHRIELSSFERLHESINTVQDCMFTRMCNPFFHSDFIYKMTSGYQHKKVAEKFLLQYGNELIDEARRRHKKSLLNVDENENIAKDKNELNRVKINFIVDQLINHVEEKYSDQEIRDHLLTLQLTASDTTTNLVGACLMYLAMNQDVQMKLFDEISGVFSKNFNIDYERLNGLKYLEMVLKETLRLFTPLPIMMREAFADCDLGTGKNVKKGTKVFVFAYILHQRKDIWGGNAAKFDPENFSAENSAKRDPYSFVPFGSGQRNCIGNRYAMIAAKVFMAELLQAYRFTTKLTEQDMKMKVSFTGKLAGKYLVSITKR